MSILWMSRMNKRYGVIIIATIVLSILSILANNSIKQLQYMGFIVSLFEINNVYDETARESLSNNWIVKMLSR